MYVAAVPFSTTARAIIGHDPTQQGLQMRTCITY